jgi:hypothetical protein
MQVRFCFIHLNTTVKTKFKMCCKYKYSKLS